MMKPVLIMTTVSDIELGKTIGKILVEEHLAACVSIVDRVNSIYAWRGEIYDDVEYLVMIKTVLAKAKKVFERVKELHSYEVPELIMIEVSDITEDYWGWMKDWLLSI